MSAGTATLNDSYQLSQSTAFQNRVQIVMISWCVQAAAEAWTVPFHRERSQWATTVLNNPAYYILAYSMVAAANATVIADATQAATNYTPLTSANRDTQEVFVTDTDINNAVFAAGNAFFRCPMA
jgi:hypothetical protein